MNSFWARYACVTPAPFFVCGFLAMIYENIKDKLLKAKNGPQNWSENTQPRFYLDQYLLNVVEVLLKKIIVEQDLLHIFRAHFDSLPLLFML